MPVICETVTMDELSGSPSNAYCSGCREKILDRYYLLAVDKPWHIDCLKCYDCKSKLDGELTCFFREGHIYCKADYYR